MKCGNRHPTEMGTHESRCLSLACTRRRRETPIGKQGEEDSKTPLQSVKETTGGSKEIPTHDLSEGSNPVCKPMLDFAQKMAEDIISQALLLCWEKEINYQEFPFIDIEQEYAI